MKATEEYRLRGIIDDVFFDDLFETVEIVVDQYVVCYLHNPPEKEELVELIRTRRPLMAAVVILGGKPKNRYEVYLQPVGLPMKER